MAGVEDVSRSQGRFGQQGEKIMDDLVCPVCFELLYDPLTLTCGHSLCCPCLADWYLASRVKNCPECRQNWYGTPKVNIKLRDITEELYPDQAAARSQELQTHKMKMKMDTFYKFIQNDEKWEEDFRQEATTRPARANTVPRETPSTGGHSAGSSRTQTTEEMLDSTLDMVTKIAGIALVGLAGFVAGSVVAGSKSKKK